MVVQIKTITYWIYYGNKIVDSVRMPEGTSDEDVKAQVIQNNNHVRLSETPVDNLKIRWGEVRTDGATK